MAPRIKEAQVVRMDNVPRTESDGCVIGLGHVLQARTRGESAGGAVVRLEIVLEEEGHGFGGRQELAVGLDELFGLFGDVAPDGVSEDGFSLGGGGWLARGFGGGESGLRWDKRWR